MSVPSSTQTSSPAPRAVVAGVAKLTAGLPGGRPRKRRLHNSPTACGLTYVVSTAGREVGFTILTYHRLLERQDPFYGYGMLLDDFKRQVRMLRRFCVVLCLDEIADRLERRRPLPRRCVALTFDDGYRDFMTLALPTLRYCGLPATLYAAVQALEQGWLWPDLLRHALRATAMPCVTLETLEDGGPRVFSLATLADRLAAVSDLDSRLKRISDWSKWLVLEECTQKLLGRSAADVTIPGLMLSWEDLRQAVGVGISVGAHTVTHPILTRMSEQEAATEITESRRRLEERLERPVRHFAYPNGQPDDLSPAIRELVRLAGFRTAVTTVPGYNRPGDDAWLLKRVDANQESLRELIRTMAEAA